MLPVAECSAGRVVPLWPAPDAIEPDEDVEDPKVVEATSDACFGRISKSYDLLSAMAVRANPTQVLLHARVS